MKTLLPLLFVILLAPTKPITKNIVLVVDTSCSMGWDGDLGMGQALQAVSAIARQPIDEARLTAIAWSDDATAYPGGWIELPDEEAVTKLEGWVSGIKPGGGTQLTKGLTRALALPVKDLTVIVVTDGDLPQERKDTILDALTSGQSKRGEYGRATVGVWQVKTSMSLDKLSALAREGGGGYVAND